MKRGKKKKEKKRRKKEKKKKRKGKKGEGKKKKKISADEDTRGYSLRNHREAKLAHTDNDLGEKL